MSAFAEVKLPRDEQIRPSFLTDWAHSLQSCWPLAIGAETLPPFWRGCGLLGKMVICRIVIQDSTGLLGVTKRSEPWLPHWLQDKILIPALFASADTQDMVSILPWQVGDWQHPESSGSPGVNHNEGWSLEEGPPPEVDRAQTAEGTQCHSVSRGRWTRTSFLLIMSLLN